MRAVSLIITTLLSGLAVIAWASPTSAALRVALPPATGTADYQLGGSYAVPAGVTVVARDSTSKPAPRVYSICYVNGFQTQGYQRHFWLTKHPSVLLKKNGKSVSDPGWPDEFILDTSTAAKRSELAGVIGKTITSCARKGFAAVEIDNLDSFSRSHGLLTASDNQRMAKLFATRAHSLGLAIAQKNTAEYSAKFKKRVGFDFAVAEECERYSECAMYTRVYPRVIDIEYTDDLRGTFADVCASTKRPAMTILRDRDLTAKGKPGYVFKHC